MIIIALYYNSIRAAGPDELLSSFSGRRVLVCGASYGIGAELALGLARANAHLVLAARSADKLANVASMCRQAGAKSVAVVSVSTPPLSR